MKTSKEKMTKETRSTTKNTKKHIKFDFVVDLTDVQCFDDVGLAFATAKFNAHMPLNDRNLEAFKRDAIADAFIISSCVCGSILKFYDFMLMYAIMLNKKAEKKPNVFKRFWNWLRRK